MFHLKVWVERSTVFLITNTMHPCINRRTARTLDLRTSLARIEAGIAQGSCSLVMLTGTMKTSLTLLGAKGVEPPLVARDLIPSVGFVGQLADQPLNGVIGLDESVA